MKLTYRILFAALSALLVLGFAACDRAEPLQEDVQSDQNPVLDEIPEKHRPEVSDSRAIKAHGITLSATYTIPNWVELSIAMRDGSECGSLTMSWQPIFEKYESGAWVKMEGQEENDPAAMMDTAHFSSPYEMAYAMPRFPEAGVYRLSLLCGGEVTAEHYAYFEVPAYELTAPTKEECPASDSDQALLTVRAEEITPNGLTLILVSKTEEKTHISYGAPYYLSCHIDGEWRSVAGDLTFHALGYGLELKEEHRMRCSFRQPLGAGHYRYAKQFNGVTYYVYFEIAG